MTWPDAEYVTYDYNEIGAVTAIKQSGTDDLVEFTYNDLGQRTALDYRNGQSVTYAYDAARRLEEIAHDLSGTSDDQTFNFTYNPAGQVVLRLSQNASYDYTALAGVTINSIINSLNQPTSVGAATVVHDARGNLTDDGSTTYAYDIYNRLTGAGLSATFDYDAPRARRRAY